MNKPTVLLRIMDLYNLLRSRFGGKKIHTQTLLAWFGDICQRPSKQVVNISTITIEYCIIYIYELPSITHMLWESCE